MDLNILGLTYFLILKRRVLALFSLMKRSLTWHCQVRFESILSPRYFIFSVGYSVLPHSLIFKSSSNLFFLDLKIIISVFLTLSEILFSLSQLNRCFKSALTSLFSFSIELLRHNKLVSSAKCWTFYCLIKVIFI